MFGLLPKYSSVLHQSSFYQDKGVLGWLLIHHCQESPLGQAPPQ